MRNTVGNIPLQWYDSLAHIGYDTSGRPIMKPDIYHGKPDAIDEFLRNTNIEDGGSSVEWRCIRDPHTGQLVLLSDGDLEIVHKSVKGEGITADSKEGPFEVNYIVNPLLPDVGRVVHQGCYANATYRPPPSKKKFHSIPVR